MQLGQEASSSVLPTEPVTQLAGAGVSLQGPNAGMQGCADRSVLVLLPAVLQ